MQGILDDFFQRPICSVRKIGGRDWCGDVGLPGPDKGKGGKYLILPPDYHGDVPKEFFAYRSRTYGVFVFWRGFFKDPKQLGGPVAVMEKTRIYPLGNKKGAKPMEFPNASGVEVNMLYPTDGSAFDVLNRFIQNEYVDPADMEMRGMAAAIGIVKGKPFKSDERNREILDKAAKTAARMGHAIAYEPQTIVSNGTWYKDRRWLNVFPGNATFTADTFNFIDPRTGFFTNAYSASPGMAANMVNVGAKYPATFVDADGEFLSGSKSYKLNLPKGIPAALFWSVTDLRLDHRIRGRQRPALSFDQHHGQAGEKRGRVDGHLLRAGIAGRRQELAAHAARQGLFRHPAAVRPDQGVLRQEVEAGRPRKTMKA